MDFTFLNIRFFVLYLFLLNCESLIPELCASNATASKMCCPAIPFYGTPCGFPVRGICKTVVYTNEYIPEILTIDDRAYWPNRFFRFVCHCVGNYFGIACEDCRVGWAGPNCNQRMVLVRRNILSLNPEERMILNNVITSGLHTYSGYVIPTEKENRLSDPNLNPTWIKASLQYKKVFDHRFASRGTLFTSDIDCRRFGKTLEFNHNGVGLLTWHRYMMLDWERELRKIALRKYMIRDFTLPYWDWTDLRYCDICKNDLVGEEGEQDHYGTRISSESPYYNWTEFCMEPAETLTCYGCHHSGQIGRLTRSWNSFEFPTLEDIIFALNQPRYYSDISGACDSFHKAAEGICGVSPSSQLMYMHNKMHNLIDGSMCCSSTSTNDPLFIFHHIQMDRILQAWYLKHRPSDHDYPDRGESPGHGRNSYLVGFLPLVTHADLFTDSLNLGYIYDNYDFSANRNKAFEQ